MIKVYECENCDYVTHSKKLLGSHKKSVHKKIINIKKCKIPGCDYEGVARNMRSHLKSHRRCGICKQSCRNIKMQNLHFCPGLSHDKNEDNFKKLKYLYELDNVKNQMVKLESNQPLRRLFTIHKHKMVCARCKNKNLAYELEKGNLTPNLFDVDHKVSQKDLLKLKNLYDKKLHVELKEFIKKRDYKDFLDFEKLELLLFGKINNYQLLCHPCHRLKSADENRIKNY